MSVVRGTEHGTWDVEAGGKGSAGEGKTGEGRYGVRDTVLREEDFVTSCQARHERHEATRGSHFENRAKGRSVSSCASDAIVVGRAAKNLLISSA